MPYKQITQLQDSVKNNLPKHAQEIYKEAFNFAEDQYGEEDRAHRVAWSTDEKTFVTPHDTPALTLVATVVK